MLKQLNLFLFGVERLFETSKHVFRALQRIVPASELTLETRRSRFSSTARLLELPETLLEPRHI